MTVDVSKIAVVSAEVVATPLNADAIRARYSCAPINAMTAAALAQDAVSIREASRARGELMPRGDDHAALLLIHQIAIHIRQVFIDAAKTADDLAHHPQALRVPDICFMTNAEMEHPE